MSDDSHKYLSTSHKAFVTRTKRAAKCVFMLAPHAASGQNNLCSIIYVDAEEQMLETIVTQSLDITFGVNVSKFK